MAEQSEIVRRPDFAGGGLTEEERERMDAHSAMWIQRAFRTEPADPLVIETAIKGIYCAANLAEPRVIVVPSPLVMAMAGGIAAIWWSLIENKLPGDKSKRSYATNVATYDATHGATRAATRAAVTNWFDLAAEVVEREQAQKALKTAARWANATQGGNMFAKGECYLTAARDILGLRLAPHGAYAYWEQAAINGGLRWMHPKFCLVSDFPEILRVNGRNRPHAEFGPSHRWRDGWSIWTLNGVQVEQWMAEWRPDDMDARRVLQIENVDQRRECIRRMGIERIIGQLDPKVLDTERREVGGEYRLLAVEMNHGRPWKFLQMVNQSTGAVHIEAVPRQCRTVRHALNWRRAQNINHDWFPAQLT
jgi:hypothetical protein